jgi:hypothetical protein
VGCTLQTKIVLLLTQKKDFTFSPLVTAPDDEVASWYHSYESEGKTTGFPCM